MMMMRQKKHKAIITYVLMLCQFEEIFPFVTYKIYSPFVETMPTQNMLVIAVIHIFCELFYEM